jgi:hypothetical protein
LREGSSGWLKTVDPEVALSEVSENLSQKLPAIRATIEDHIGRPQRFFQKPKHCDLPADCRAIARAYT